MADRSHLYGYDSGRIPRPSYAGLPGDSWKRLHAGRQVTADDLEANPWEVLMTADTRDGIAAAMREAESRLKQEVKFQSSDDVDAELGRRAQTYLQGMPGFETHLSESLPARRIMGRYPSQGGRSMGVAPGAYTVPEPTIPLDSYADDLRRRDASFPAVRRGGAADRDADGVVFHGTRKLLDRRQGMTRGNAGYIDRAATPGDTRVFPTTEGIYRTRGVSVEDREDYKLAHLEDSEMDETRGGVLAMDHYHMTPEEIEYALADPSVLDRSDYALIDDLVHGRTPADATALPTDEVVRAGGGGAVRLLSSTRPEYDGYYEDHEVYAGGRPAATYYDPASRRVVRRTPPAPAGIDSSHGSYPGNGTDVWAQRRTGLGETEVDYDESAEFMALPKSRPVLSGERTADTRLKLLARQKAAAGSRARWAVAALGDDAVHGSGMYEYGPKGEIYDRSKHDFVDDLGFYFAHQAERDLGRPLYFPARGADARIAESAAYTAPSRDADLAAMQLMRSAYSREDIGLYPMETRIAQMKQAAMDTDMSRDPYSKVVGYIRPPSDGRRV